MRKIHRIPGVFWILGASVLLVGCEIAGIGSKSSDNPPDIVSDVTPDTTKDVPPDTTKDVPPDTSTDIPPDTTKDVPPDPQSGLKVVGSFPEDGAVAVPPGTPIKVNFSKRIDPATANASTIGIRNGTGPWLPASVEVDSRGTEAVLRTVSALQYQAVYKLEIKSGASGVQTAADESLPADWTISFTTSAAPTNSARKLLTWAEIEAGFVGAFNVPSGGESGSEYRFAFSEGVHTQLENGNILMEGHPHFGRQAELRLPANLNGSEAVRVGSWANITGGLQPAAFTGDAYILGGMLQIGSRMYFTKHQWYNGGVDWPSQGYNEGGRAFGMWAVSGSGAHSQRVGGYMSYAPEAITSAGFAYLAGQQGFSGGATGRWGPNLFAIQPNPSANPGGTWASRPLVYHEAENRKPEGWWVGDRVSGVAWIESDTKHAVLFLLNQQVGGQTWYGETTDNVGSPYSGDKGYHASGYALKAWIYNPDDLMDVFRGTRQAWTVRPAEEAILIERRPGSTTETHRSFITGQARQNLQMSLRNGRIVIVQPHANRRAQSEPMPKGYVIDLK